MDVTVLLLEASQRLLPFALDELRREQPDVVVFDGICLWGMQAAHLLNLPRVSSIATMVLEGVKGVIKPRELPGMILSALPRLPRIRRLRRRLEEQYGQGVFPNKDLFPCVGQKTIVFTSREFQPPTPSSMTASISSAPPSIRKPVYRPAFPGTACGPAARLRLPGHDTPQRCILQHRIRDVCRLSRPIHRVGWPADRSGRAG